MSAASAASPALPPEAANELPPGWREITLANGQVVYQDEQMGVHSELPSANIRIALLQRRVDLLERQLASRDFDSGWMHVQSNETNTVTIRHNRGAYPTGGITVLFSTTNPPTKVYDVSSSNYCANHSPYNSAFHTGTFEFTEDAAMIPLWSGGCVGRYWDGTTWFTYKTGFLRFILHF